VEKSTIKKEAENLSRPGRTLPQKIAQGGFWIFSLKIARKAFSLIRLIIIGRILAPSDFGLMGIALLTMSAIETFSQTGYREALIQRKKEVKGYLDTAWTVLIIRGLLIFIILYFAAPYIALFFHTPEVKPIIQVLGLITFLQAFSNIGIIFFHKELEFNKVFIYHFLGTFTNFFVAVIAAIILRSVWALVLGLFAEKIISLIISYFIHPYRPRLSGNIEKAKELFGFGRWILGSSALVFIGEHIDDIFVGKVLSAIALGFYQMGYRISNMLETEITQVISSVTFPGYAKIQDKQTSLQKAYFRIMRLTTAISIPITAGIVLLAPEFTGIFLGQKWLPIVPVMQLLAIAGLMKSIVSTGSPLFNGSGYPNYEFYMQLIRGLVIIIVIYPLIALMGISGAALGVIISIIGMIVVWYPLSQRITGASGNQYLNTLWPPLLGSLLMAASIYIMKLYWNPLIIVLMSILVYFGALFILKKYYPSYDLLGEVRFLYQSLVNR
jgi:O-antigen/teichoic acid export membrane protein